MLWRQCMSVHVLSFAPKSLLSIIFFLIFNVVKYIIVNIAHRVWKAGELQRNT